VPVLQRLVLAVETAAPVSHEQAAIGRSMQLAKRINAVLERHGSHP
jgi:hypothetical protein